MNEEELQIDELVRFEESIHEESFEWILPGNKPDVGNNDDLVPLKECLQLLEQYRRTRNRQTDSTQDGHATPTTPIDAAWTPTQIGPYCVQHRLGVGAGGVVYLAEDLAQHRLVAIKLLRPEGLYFSELHQRFVRESQILGQLRNPHIAEVLDAGEHHGLPYLVSTYYAASSLDRQLREQTCFAPAQAAEIARQIAVATQYAHANGVIHRDIKPSNVLIERCDKPLDSEHLPIHVRLTDFGLATFYESADRSTSSTGLTRTGHALGTIAYMSPEQAAGRRREVGPHSDIWSIGVVLFELVTGNVPLPNATVASMLQQIESGNWDPFRRESKSTSVAIPPDLKTIILKTLAPLPADRYQSAADLAEDLQRFCQQRPITARRLSRTERLMRWGAKNRTLAGGIVTLTCLALVSVFAVMAFYSNALSNRADELSQAVSDKESALRDSLSAETLAKQREQEANAQRQRAEQSELAARELSYRYGMQTTFNYFSDHNLVKAREFALQQIPGQGQSDVRTLEWHLLHDALQSRVRYFGQHQGAANEVAVFANDTMAASVGDDGFVKIWDLTSECLVRQFQPQLGPLHAIAVTPDQSQLAIGVMANPANGDVSRVYILDAMTGEVQRTLHSH
ncbi:MAG: protein kinase, partial [Planctomycetales bacterium]|nr:protein kinase [Planctomycetales bacterium]